jgi:hypothetical protein
MTNIKKILEFLTDNQHAYCDDCLSVICGVSPRQQVNKVCNEKINVLITTNKGGFCHTCHKQKQTRQIKTSIEKKPFLKKNENNADIENSIKNIQGINFCFIQEINPIKDINGNYITERPQDGSNYLDTRKFHRFGNQNFCILNVHDNLPDGSFVYILSDDNDNILYIGESENLQRRWRTNYKKISPSDPFEGGQRTNCRINANILSHYQSGKKVFLYAFEVNDAERKRLEDMLIKAENYPPWNDNPR